MNGTAHHAAGNLDEGGGSRPTNVGILAAEVYFPSTYVDQAEMEKANGVSSGKYTIGLGQLEMAFTGDREDINSIALTALAGLLEKFSIDPNDIGRLEVGTETLIDKSKSTKTVLMSLLGDNQDVEGVTTVNACYGGTAALLNSIAWIESSAWDGRYAIVVAADIAVYAEGPARPTGGCGAVAVLIGPDAPLAVNARARTTHACDVWDFFKPDMSSEYPRVDGALSQSCYLRAIDDCYSRFAEKKERSTAAAAPAALDGAAPYTAESADHFLFHSPYNKLVQKSYARLFFTDARRCSAVRRPLPPHLAPLEPWLDAPLEDTYNDVKLAAALKGVAAAAYKARVAPGCVLSQRIGNTYTASVFANIACLVDREGAALDGARVAVFSYGSGALATLYELVGRAPTSTAANFTLARMQASLALEKRLSAREKLTAEDLSAALAARAAAHDAAPFAPAYPPQRLFPGTFYLAEVRADATRRYARVPADAQRSTGGPLLAAAAAASNGNGVANGENGTYHAAEAASGAAAAVAAAAPEQLQLSLQPLVVAGVACGLPGQENVFEADNLERLLSGTSFLAPLCATSIGALLEKNVVQLRKSPPERIAITEESQTIRVAARLGSMDLTKYGVSASIAATMDKAVQVAVAAGLEALRDAGLVKGGPAAADWLLPESMRDSTGVVYATSYPALDAAIGEVMRFLRSRCVTRARKGRLVAALRARMRAHGTLTDADEESLRNLERAVVTKSTVNLCNLAHAAEEAEAALSDEDEGGDGAYAFDRKFLFRILVLGNAQLAQIVGARGPNMQTNAACAGSTQAVAMAQDMLTVGRAARMIVIAGDDASGDALLPWVGNGFRALGAASIAATAEAASRPFDAARNGMILGSGAIGMVLETRAAAAAAARPLAARRRCARLLETQISNSAHHGASMDRAHIAREMERFLVSVEARHGVTRADIAARGVYFSHETGTHASPTASCAYNEVWALRACFGALLPSLTVINTKGFTGHPMGVSFEDVAAVQVLRSGVLPPTANTVDVDPTLGDLKLSRGGRSDVKYALRFAAGFGSQVALALYAASDEAA